MQLIEVSGGDVFIVATLIRNVVNEEEKLKLKHEQPGHLLVFLR